MQLSRGLRLGWAIAAAVLLGGLLGRSLWIHARLQYGVLVARQALNQGDPKIALAALELIERWGSARCDVQYLLAVANRRDGNLNRVEHYLKRAAELGWPGPDLKRQRALAAFQSGRTNESKPYLDRLIRSNVSDEAALEIYEGMTKGYLLDLRLRDAERCLKHWIAWRPQDVQPRLWLADIWHSISDNARERQELADLLALHPGNVEARQKYGECFLQINELPEALTEFESCHEIAPLDAKFVLLMAYCRNRLGDTQQAESLLHDALRMEHDDFQESFALTVLGQMDLEQKRYQDAEIKLQRAISLTPQSEMTHFALATALTRLGKRNEAQQHFKIASDMEDEDVRLADLTRNVMTHPDDADARLEVGRIMLKRGSAAVGLRWLRSALVMSPNDRRIYEELAAEYEKQGQRETAADYRRKAQLLADAEGKSFGGLQDRAGSSVGAPSAGEEGTPLNDRTPVIHP